MRRWGDRQSRQAGGLQSINKTTTMARETRKKKFPQQKCLQSNQSADTRQASFAVHKGEVRCPAQRSTGSHGLSGDIHASAPHGHAERRHREDELRHTSTANVFMVKNATSIWPSTSPPVFQLSGLTLLPNTPHPSTRMSKKDTRLMRKR